MDWQLSLFNEEPIEIGQERPIKKYCPQQGEVPDITRIKILYECYRRIYYLLHPRYNQNKIGKFIIYHDYLEAVVEGTDDLSIRDRIKIHIKAIKDLRNGK